MRESERVKRMHPPKDIMTSVCYLAERTVGCGKNRAVAKQSRKHYD